jgi:chaperone required for assembly of F1-ATPase
MSKSDPILEARRFYATVAVGEGEGGEWRVLLDGRRARTPGGRLLATPTRALAEMIAQEWSNQGPSIEPASMPATRLAGQVLDGGEAARAAQIAALDRYGASDLLCYFAEAPKTLVERQERVWGPLLDWAQEARGLRFERAAGIIHRPQPPATQERLTQLARDAEPFALAGLALGAALFGSVVLALALQAGRLDAAAAVDAAQLDETYQQERWGLDPEAAARREALAGEAAMLGRWFRALD